MRRTISGRQEPQLVPAPVAAPIASTVAAPPLTASSMVRAPTFRQAQTVGMTFTIEPGVYLPGLGGVRIEDDMVVVPGGGESLSDWDRELMVLG